MWSLLHFWHCSSKLQTLPTTGVLEYGLECEKTGAIPLCLRQSLPSSAAF